MEPSAWARGRAALRVSPCTLHPPSPGGARSACRKHGQMGLPNRIPLTGAPEATAGTGRLSRLPWAGSPVTPTQVPPTAALGLGLPRGRAGGERVGPTEVSHVLCTRACRCAHARARLHTQPRGPTPARGPRSTRPPGPRQASRGPWPLSLQRASEDVGTPFPFLSSSSIHNSQREAARKVSPDSSENSRGSEKDGDEPKVTEPSEGSRAGEEGRAGGHRES